LNILRNLLQANKWLVENCLSANCFVATEFFITSSIIYTASSKKFSAPCTLPTKSIQKYFFSKTLFEFFAGYSCGLVAAVSSTIKATTGEGSIPNSTLRSAAYAQDDN